ncbi:hypothetical protein UF64_06905 [Thalassospira sp. HJ]|uniref:asparagine synthase-related protein n=1 Tax=Thalassospira sp. HJ TaxID=1616823 RepID=UPI0005CDD431|nr:asparagine synthase-related protein [Thalassospira sp. HJ]KJE35836.1 hypothetical protein UF64_06905 [Thalassospira sp. HJ]
MTGAIACVLRFDDRNAKDDCLRMASSMDRYGPKRRQVWSDGTVSVAKLLSCTLPEDFFEKQPVCLRAGKWCGVAAARLDDRAGVIAGLGLDTKAAARLSDSDLLLLALEKWEEEAPARIPGQYGFIVWNAEQQRLLCGRDALGRAPLYFYRSERFIAVASMPAGLLALPDVPQTLSETWIAHRLMAAAPTGSCFEFIDELEPGHFLIAEKGNINCRKWWCMPERGSVQPDSATALKAQGRELFFSAVKSCLRSTKPIAAQLSSGCDSGAVAAAAAVLLSEQGRSVDAYTAAPHEDFRAKSASRLWDESEKAAILAARHGNMRHHVIRIGRQNPFSYMDRSAQALQQPHRAPANNVWLTELDNAARRNRSEVMLTGGIGNLTISYSGVARLSEMLNSLAVPSWLREAFLLWRRQKMSWKAIAYHSFAPHTPRGAWEIVARVLGNANKAKKSVIAPEFFQDMLRSNRLSQRALLPRMQPSIFGNDRRLAGFGRLSLGLDRYADYAETGIEHRDPTEDQRLVEFTLGLSEEWFLRNGKTKFFLRLIGEDLLPEHCFDPDTPRGGQSANWYEGLTDSRASLREELEILARHPHVGRYVDLESLKGLVEDWPGDRWESKEIIQLYKQSLMRGVATARFIRQMIPSNY